MMRFILAFWVVTAAAAALSLGQVVAAVADGNEPAEAPAAADMLPGEMPPALEEAVLAGVSLRRLGDEAFLFDSPSAVARIPGSPGWVVVAMQRGELWCAHPETGERRLFLDFRKRMQGIILFEEGVHGIAFHPQFLSNGLFFI